MAGRSGSLHGLLGVSGDLGPARSSGMRFFLLHSCCCRNGQQAAAWVRSERYTTATEPSALSAVARLGWVRVVGTQSVNGGRVCSRGCFLLPGLAGHRPGSAGIPLQTGDGLPGDDKIIYSSRLDPKQSGFRGAAPRRRKGTRTALSSREDSGGTKSRGDFANSTRRLRRYPMVAAGGPPIVIHARAILNTQQIDSL